MYRLLRVHGRRAGAAARAFGAGDGGAMTTLGVVFAAMLLAFGAIVVDFGRLYNLHSEMQAYVDHVALAAAAELDGEGDAIERARRAALGPAPGPLVADTQSFAIGAAALEIEEPVFLRALPPDADPDLAPFVTAESREARFVRVSARPRTQSFILMPLVRLFGITEAATEATVGAQAVAGFTREVCNFPPLMMCNPYEAPGGGGDFTPIVGQQILLKTQGAGASWAPGDFGLLDTVLGAGEGVCTGGLGGTNRIRCVMGLINPNSSCVAGRVNVRPGAAVSIHAGLNVRFDIWDPPLQSKRNDPQFAPAANVTKGLAHPPNQCAMNRFDPAPDTVRLPRDGCFGTGTCGHGRFGDVVTTAQLGDYWAANHGGAALPGSLIGGTRYDAYRYEIDNGMIPRSTAPGGENGAPSCAPAGVDNPLRDRRSLIVAVVNCVEHGVRGSADDVPVIAFGEVFMTEPVGGPPDHDLYVEMLGVVDPGGDDGVLHDYPQLYR